MNPVREVILRPFVAADAAAIAALLRAANPTYLQFFRPFAFEASAIIDLVSRKVRDAWFLLEIRQGSDAQTAGFYMLRGIDEGFAEPMYGVFVAESFAGCGLGRLTLAHARRTAA